MKNLTATICHTIVLLFGITGVSESAEPVKGYCGYAETFHLPVHGKCSNSFETGDYASALREWTQLSEQGNAVAQHNLAMMFFDGAGVPQDYKTAAKWYTLAAKQGNADAQYNLAAMYFDGAGVPQDYKTAAKWYTLAAKQGMDFVNAGLSQISLGYIYSEGIGVPQDFVRSHMWYNIATMSDEGVGSVQRDNVAKLMTPAQIADAQKLARECVRKKYIGC